MDSYEEAVKRAIIQASPAEQLWVQRPYVHVHMTVTLQGIDYQADGFSKYSTDDQGIVANAKRDLRRGYIYAYPALGQGKIALTAEQREYRRDLIKRLSWNPERGIAIAKGKALAGLVKQAIKNAADVWNLTPREPQWALETSRDSTLKEANIYLSSNGDGVHAGVSHLVSSNTPDHLLQDI